jgi:serine/threonine-protein kinase
MSTNLGAGSAALPLSLERRVNAACRRFEAAWRAGARPPIEDYLADGPEPARQALLAELLALEVAYRVRDGDAPATEEYRARFPGHDALIDEAFRSLDASTVGPPSIPEGATVPEEAPRHGAPTGPEGEPPVVPGYEVLSWLGQGGMAVVWRGRDRRLRRDVAIKVMKAELAGEPQLARRFLEEAQVASQLQHPAIPPVHELGALPDGRPYFAMRLVKGRTLADLLKGRPDPGHEQARWLAIFEQVCQAVAYAHSKGVIHRDLKPRNVMVGAFGEVQVMDWGLAKVLEADPPPGAAAADEAGSVVATARTAGADDATRPGSVLGTYAYMAPEQARGKVELLDRRCDVFGLGAMLCEVLTGQPPYVGTAAEVEAQAGVGHLAPAWERLAACGADEELVRLARRCLSAQAEERPAEAGEVAGAVAAHLAGVRERLRKAELERAAAQARAVEERKRRRAQLALAAAALLLAVGGGGLLWRAQHLRHLADAAVARPLDEAKRLRAEARRATTLAELEKFAQALAAANRAEELAGTSGASADVRREAAALVAELQGEAGAQERDRRLLTALLEVRGPREGPRYQKDDKGFIATLPEPSTEEQFQAAFRAWDERFDVDRLPAETVASLKGRPPVVLTEVIAALDEWAGERRKDTALLGRDPTEWRRRWRGVADLATTLDDSGPRRGELRDILMVGGLEGERALGALAMALRPVPVPFDALPKRDRDRVRRLADNVDVRGEPVLGLLALAQALRLAGDEAGAGRLLRDAVLARPQEVVLLHALGGFLEEQRPSRWAEAVECYAAARALRPELGAALAAALVESGRVEHGLALYQQLLAERKDNPWIHEQYGNACCYVSHFQEAETACREALRLKPDFPKAHTTLGWALSSQGRYKEAEAACREALQFKPDFPGAHSTLGLALDRQGRYKEAEAACREALRLKPDIPEAHNNLGVALWNQGHDREAEAAFREALRLKPDFPKAHQNLGSTLNRQGRYKEAEAACREALRLKPDMPFALGCLGHTLYHQGRFQEAEAAFREAVRLQPDYLPDHVNLGIMCAHLGRWHQAVADYSTALEHQADWQEVRNHRAYAYSVLGQWDKAAADLAPVARANPGDEAAWFQLACLRFLQGDTRGYEEVCAHLRERARDKEQVTGDQASNLCRTTALPARVDRETARQLVRWGEQGVASQPRAPWYLHFLALAHYRAGQAEQSVGYCRKSLEADPRWEGRMQNWLLLALAHHQLGHRDESLQWMDKAVKWREAVAGGPRPADVTFPPNMHLSDWLEFEVLYREAQGPLKKAEAGQPGR